MHMVLIRDLCSALWAVGDLGNISQESLKHSLEQLFQGVLQNLPVQAVPEATEQTARLLFKLYDREKTGFVPLRSVEAALIVLSGDTLSAKHRGLNPLFQLGVSCSRRQGTEDAFVSRAGLRNLLDDLSQVPAVVQESHVFGSVEAAIQSCFTGVINRRAGEEHFVSWLQSEPRLLLWLSTLYRLSVSEAVQHRVRCHACKAFPIIGLRYRCLKCLNVHLCQNCFLTKKRTRKHKPSHPVLEYCTQPSWKESVASLASSARHVLLPRRYTRRETERRRPLITGSNEETHDRCPLSLSAHVSGLQQQECVDNLEGLDIVVSENVPPSPPPPPLPLQLNMESKSLQTDESDSQPQRKMSLLQKDLSITQNVMKDLQRDKGLLEKEFQVWKVAAQSEHESLEDRCRELEANMEVLIQHNQQLEQELGQVRHALSMRGRDEFGSDIHTPPPQQHSRDDTSEKQFTESESPASYTSSATEKDQETATGEVREREQQVKEKETLNQVQEEGRIDVVITETCVTETKKVVQLVGESEQEQEEEEEPHFYRQELIGNDITLDGSVIAEDSGTDHSDEEEEELCDLVQRLHGALLSTPTGCGSRQTDTLLQAAGGVGDSVFHLVTSLKSINSPVQDMEQGSANSGPHGKALFHQASLFSHQ
ncbi:dystrotelin isoform X1 [Pangasianodon hypophthalmus]|uniref:dystrotelin isoform X1 n=1 Tax=Pangasianodon hypophthalmus TaxID=310915 RepID=UPI002307F63E|nr:dystrotelin isoform X1 [Pangasianodon hypophthalmus]